MNENEMPLDLNVDMSDVSTAMPLIPNGTVALLGIKSFEVSPNKAGTGKNLMVQFFLEEPTTSTMGDTINRGFPLRKYYPLQQSDKEGAPDFRRDVKLLLMAVFNTDEDNCPNLTSETLSQLPGQQVVGTIKIDKGTPEYPNDSNSISKLVAVG